MYSVCTKTLYDKRWFILGWMLGAAFLGFVMTLFYPSFHQDNGIDQLVKSLPQAFQGLVGNLGDLKHISTYIGSQLFDIRIPLIVSILSIVLASSLTVGEEDKGQLRTLIALPLSRGRIIFEKWLAIVVITLIAVSGTLLGTYLGLLIIHETIDSYVLLKLVGLTWLLCATLCTLVFGIGMASGRRSVTIGAATIIAVGSFLLTTFAQAVDWLQPYEKISLLHYFPAIEVARGVFNWNDAIVLASIMASSLIVAWLIFRRRDVS